MTDIALALLEENKQLQATIDELKADLVHSAQPPNKASLYAKKAAVMARLNRIPESGKHQQGWKYSTSEDVKDPVRVAMAEAGLSLAFDLIDYETIREDKRIIITGNVRFTLQCGETGATETSLVPAEAIDWVKGGGATAEKTFFKLYTTAQKYYLKTTFLISSGEELDSDRDTPVVERVRKSAPTNGNMSLDKLLALLRKVEVSGMATFYGKPEDIMACRAKGSPLPAVDDVEGWRNLFADARDYAIDRINEAVERGDVSPDQIPLTEGFGRVEPGEGFVTEPPSAMDEVEAEEDAQMMIDSGQIDTTADEWEADEAPF